MIMVKEFWKNGILYCKGNTVRFRCNDDVFIGNIHEIHKDCISSDLRIIVDCGFGRFKTISVKELINNESINEFHKVKKVSKEKMKDTKNVTVPTIKEYKVINDKVVIVTFTDNTTEKAICSEEDTFDFDKAIEICVLKKVLGGTSTYNTILNKAHKNISNIKKNEEKEAKRQAEETLRLQKLAEKKQANKAKRVAKKVEELIAITSAAFLKAMVDYDRIQVEKNYQDFQEEVDRLNSANAENGTN